MESNIKTGDFFSLQNSVESINESDYEKTGLIIEAARAFERSTYQCVYIIDYFKRGFLYVSGNIAKLCGGEAEKIKDFGYRFYIDYVPQEDLKMIQTLQHDSYRREEGLHHILRFPYNERKMQASCQSQADPAYSYKGR